MINTGKYRQYSIVALIVMVVAFLLSFVSLWNSLLTSSVKHEGWLIFFLLLLFVAGMLLFLIAYKNTDENTLDLIRKNAYESGKAEILKEMEKRNAEESDTQKIEDDILDKKVQEVLTGLQSTRSQAGFCNKVLTSLSNHLGFVQGILYLKDTENQAFKPAGEYALTDQKPQPFTSGENLNGQVAESGQMMVLYDVPENYFSIASGLGTSKPRFLVLVPVTVNNASIAVLELAAFKKPDEYTRKFLSKISNELGNKLNKFIAA